MLLRHGATAAAFLILLAFGSCSDQNRFDLARDTAVRITAGEFCGISDMLVRTDMSMPSLSVSSYPPICSIWPRSIAGTTIISGVTNLAGYRVPIIVYIKSTNLSGPFRSPKRILLRVAGGPGLPIGPHGFEKAYVNALDRGDVMIAVGYIGTSYGSLYPAENFTVASDQVAELTNRLHERMPAADISLIGESLGGPIAIDSQKGIKSDFRIKTILVAPMLDSVSAQLKYTMTRFSREGSDASVFPIKLFSSSRQTDYTVSLKSVSSENLLSAFFPIAERDISLITRLRLRRVSRERLLVIFGSEDRTLDPAGVSVFSKLYSDRVVSIQGMGHGITDQYANQIENEIAKFIRK